MGYESKEKTPIKFQSEVSPFLLNIVVAMKLHVIKEGFYTIIAKHNEEIIAVNDILIRLREEN
ncbi:hypothetical protein ABD73_08065 [Brevibacillus laterosporus]|nr:hypothetical protein [Brevibacillus laterosporus]